AEIDAKTLKVTRKWPLGSCKGATGLAIDRAHHILFSGCRTKVMAISNATEGKLITTLPIGAGVDATRYDAGTGDAFASTGETTAYSRCRRSSGRRRPSRRRRIRGAARRCCPIRSRSSSWTADEPVA